MRGGATIGHLVRRVSRDGKTLTIVTDMTNARSTKVHEEFVYDRE